METMWLDSLSLLSNLIFTLPILALATVIATVAYRCTLHPLCSFPGPTLAAASGLFIFYHDVINDGKLHLALEKLHDQYGEPSPPQFVNSGRRTYVTQDQL